jgi:hypothetical protein
VSNGGGKDIYTNLATELRTVPTGPKNMKLGVMATEGDELQDYLKYRKLNSTNADYVSLSLCRK